MIDGTPGWTLALVGWWAGRAAMWDGLFAPPPNRFDVGRSTWIAFLLVSGVGIGLWASSDGDAAFTQRTGATSLALLGLVSVAAQPDNRRRAGALAVFGAAGWSLADLRAATAFGDVGGAREAHPHSPGFTLFFGLLLFAAAVSVERGRVGRRVAAFVAAGLEWAWVSRHLWLPESHGFPDRVDVAAMPETLRFPFLALWSGIGFAGMLGLALRERRGTEST